MALKNVSIPTQCSDHTRAMLAHTTVGHTIDSWQPYSGYPSCSLTWKWVIPETHRPYSDQHVSAAVPVSVRP